MFHFRNLANFKKAKEYFERNELKNSKGNNLNYIWNKEEIKIQ